jgi:hypothetical protein
MAVDECEGRWGGDKARAKARVVQLLLRGSSEYHRSMMMMNVSRLAVFCILETQQTRSR